MRTFTKTLMAFALIGFLMTSCGGGSEICNCVSTNLSMMKDMKAAGEDADDKKIEEIEKKYEAKMEKCKKLGDGKSQEELEKMEEEAKKCSSYKEIEKLREEM